MFHGAMSNRRSSRRRGLALLSIAVFAVSVSLAVPGIVSGAGANIANPGNVNVSMNLSVLTPTLSVAGISTPKPAAANITSSGALVIPVSSIAFAPVGVTIGPPNPWIGNVTVQAVAEGDFVGAVDPGTGVEWIAGRIELLLSQPGTLASCPVGPFTVHLTTSGPGSRPYAANTGIATMIDPNFAIDALAPNTKGCAGLEGLVNGALSLPITTTTTTTASAPTSSTTTTLAPSATTPGTSVLSDTPVPAVVLSTTISSAANHPPTTLGVVTTTKQGGITTIGPAKQITFGSRPPKPKTPSVTPASGTQATHQTNPVTHKSTSHKKRHPGRHRKNKVVIRPRRTLHRPLTAIKPARRNYGYFRGFATGPKAKAHAHPPTSAGLPLNATLASSRHRASPSMLNLLAMLVLLVSGAFAVKLMKPDFNDVMRARSKRRARIYGIEPRP